MPQPALENGILFTDQYQLTMAQVYFRMGLAQQPALFEMFYRRNPDYGQHQAGYTVFAGLDPLLDWMEEARFGTAELEVLASQRSSTGKPLFDQDFLDWLCQHGHFADLKVRAIPEGRVVHPQVPLVTVEGPLIQAQLLETALLARLGFETLIATKASRIREVAGQSTVLEFGLRRAAGVAGNAATRASLIGGADRSSNVGMSQRLGLQAAGTHAHALVQVFMGMGMSELEAFRAYAQQYPDDTLLLIDTVDVEGSGLPNALTVFAELRSRGHRPLGVRLDSGDLAYLSIQVARELDRQGFVDQVIVLSSDLDELVIWQIHTQIRQEAVGYGVDPEALIGRLVFGVGTRMVTSWGHPALGAVYKLVAIQKEGRWNPAIKLSESREKVINPGHKQVWRVYDRRGLATADLLSLADESPQGQTQWSVHHPTDPAKKRILGLQGVSLEALHQPVFAGKRLFAPLSLDQIRQRRRADVERLDPGVRRLLNPHVYHVSLSDALWQLKEGLVRRWSTTGGG